VDRVYMGYLQALTGHGGWPLSAWLTPDLKPFYAGTYFAPEDRQGRAGFPTILRAIARGWREDRARLVSEADRVVASLRERAAAGPGPSSGAVATLAEAAGAAFEKAYRYYVEAFDQENGGFGGAPKFPRPGNLDFLLRCAVIQGLESEAGREACSMVSRTLGAMARGGVHDHVGGGFHRYSVDAEWFLPHFEKMLYDQAQMACTALDASRATGSELPAWLARSALDYVLRDMADEQGGFHSAEDADSPLPDGSGTAEGAYYVWSQAELERVLGPDAAFFADHYGMKEGGNVARERDPQGEFTGKNVIAQVRPFAATAKLHGLGEQQANDLLVSCIGRLRAARSARPRPHRDDKVVAGWNGLMISALARAAASPSEALAERRRDYLDGALRAAAFVRKELLDPQGGMPRRSWRRGTASGPGFAEDCAFLVQAWLDLYEATFDVAWLSRAEELQRVMDERFWDPAAGGYFNSAAGAADVLVRLKEDYDGAEPAASSTAALNLYRLSALNGDEGLRERGRRTIAAFRGTWEEAPHAMPQMLCALENAMEPPRHVVLTGEPGSPRFQELLAVLRGRLGPRRAVIALDGRAGSREWFAARLPWLAQVAPAGDTPTAYVCEEFTCKAPARTAAELLAALGHPGG